MAGPQSKDKPLSIFNVASLGIGAMVGAGIFSLLGQAAVFVHSATWLSFAIGGVIALWVFRSLRWENINETYYLTMI